MIDITHVATFTTPAVVIVGGVRWAVGVLWKRFDAKLNQAQELILTIEKTRTIEAKELERRRALEAKEVKDALVAYQAVTKGDLDALKSGHQELGERIARLEGRA